MNRAEEADLNPRSSTGGIGPLELLVVPIRRWRALVSVVATSGLIAAVVSLMLPERYEVDASFVADPGRSLEMSSGLASLAGRIGLGDLQIGPSSAQFYADLLDLLVVPIRRWRALVSVVATSGLIAAVVSLMLPERYEVDASFVADPGRSLEMSSGLASLAGRIGLGDLQIGPSSPQFYADL